METQRVLVNLLLGCVLGALPFLVWLSLGFVGGLVIVVLWPAFAAYLGWRIHQEAAGRCRTPVLLYGAVAAFVFMGAFFLGLPSLAVIGRGDSLLKPIVGGTMMFLAMWLFTSAIIGLGVVARHSRVS
jgi:hypothetical protein